MFEKSLTDLIRGIRANKKNEQKYIAVCLQEIHNEVKSNDPDIKGIAVAKLTYLQMLGYDMTWASFHIVEVMSSPKMVHKRTGYLAATQSFQQDTDVLMLTTNLIKKDLASPSPLDVGIAANGLAHIVTPELALDLCRDLMGLLNHSRPLVRKKVVLVLYKVFLKYPESLRECFPKLKEKLDDPDPSVVSAVVNIVCELARKNPKNYLSLAPQLFKLLTTSSNNWMLIKIIKLFASLTPLEPRLIKKLLPPLTSLIQTTPAMSLLYECVYTVITGGFLEAAGDTSQGLASICINKLRKFLEDPDQNLKYVGLLAMNKVLSTYPRLVAEHQDIIMECIDSDDISIRLRALDLVVGMANRKSIEKLVKRLQLHIAPPKDANSVTALNELPTIYDMDYRTDIINRIIFICSQNMYSNITSFEWYIDVLLKMTYTSGVNVGETLRSQLIDVSVRVQSVREYAVKNMVDLLHDEQFLETAKKRDSNIETLAAAAWICGEYCEFIDNEHFLSTLERLLSPGVTSVPPSVQAIYVQSILKIFAYWMTTLIEKWNREVKDEFLKVTDIMKEKIDLFARNVDLEVQERAYNVKMIFEVIINTLNTETDVSQPSPLLTDLNGLLFIYELNPVAPKAQKKVPIPTGLDLDTWIHEPLPELMNDTGSDSAVEEMKPKSKSKKKSKKGHDSDNEQKRELRRKARQEQRRNDPYYIQSKPKGGDYADMDGEEDIDSIPIVALSLEDIEGMEIPKRRKQKRVKRTKRPPPMAPVYAPEEMPENAVDSASDEDVKTKNPKQVIYTKKNAVDIFETEDSGLNNVDLSTPQDQVPQTSEDQIVEEKAKTKAEKRERRERREKKKSSSKSTKK